MTTRQQKDYAGSLSDFEGQDADKLPKTPGSDKPFYHDHAVLSQAAYNPKKYETQTQGLGYEIDKDLSSRSRTVYYHRYTGKAVVAYKGTTPSSWKDLVADAHIASLIPNHLSGRFRGAEATYRKARSKYGADNVEVTGHSLGGSQALHVGRKYGVKGTAFEPGAGASDVTHRVREVASDLRKKSKFPIDRIHEAFSKAISPEKKGRSGVHIVTSTFKKNAPKKFNPKEIALHQAEYGIAALTRLGGHEKRTYVRPKYQDNHSIKNFV